MSSGFVSSSTLSEERQKRQEEWEKVRKPEDPQVAPEPEVCNKTLFEQLQDNKEAKQAEYLEAKKMKNMIRGIDEDESDFLSQIDEIKAQTYSQNKKEEEELLKEIATSRVIVAEPPSRAKITVHAKSGKPINAQANLLSNAIKRKGSKNEKTEEPQEKAAKNESEGRPAISAMQIIGANMGVVNYEMSSDSDSTDSEPGFLPALHLADKRKKKD